MAIGKRQLAGSARCGADARPELPALGLAHIDGPRELIALVIDAEGYDATILKTIDWNRLRPWLLIYEHVHLAAERAERVKARLGRHGYVCALRDQENTYCLRDDTRTFLRCARSI